MRGALQKAARGPGGGGGGGLFGKKEQVKPGGKELEELEAQLAARRARPLLRPSAPVPTRRRPDSSRPPTAAAPPARFGLRSPAAPHASPSHGAQAARGQAAAAESRAASAAAAGEEARAEAAALRARLAAAEQRGGAGEEVRAGDG